MFRQQIPLGFAIAISVLVPVMAFGHHSRANYDMTQEIVFEGMVTELAWKNPHIFMTVDTQDEGGKTSRVEIEVMSVSEAKALGLPREAIAPGTRVVVRTHPGRRVPVARALGLDLRTDGGVLYPLNTDALLAIRHDAVEAQGIAGHWAPTVQSFGDFFAAMLSWPLTEAGRVAIATSKVLTSPTVAALGICEPFPPPTLSVFPDLRTIEVNDTTVVMRFEGSVGLMMERVVHLNQNDHLPGIAPSLMGDSIGRWDGETLVIDTVAFTPHPVGGFLYPSGSGKHLVERLTLAENRLSLECVFTLEDPEFLAQPVSSTATWEHRPDLEFSGETCDPEAAQHPLVE